MKTFLPILLVIALALPTMAEEPMAQLVDKLTVPDLILGTDIMDREVVGEATSFTRGQRVYCWTRVLGGEMDDLITHIWYFEDSEIQRVELPVHASHWRTWSYKTIFPGMAGSWRVEVRDSADQVLADTVFTTTE
jgi:hypothetical protein